MKKIYCLLICGLLTLAACTEEFSPSIDYGARTYINDYQKLVDASNITAGGFAANIGIIVNF